MKNILRKIANSNIAGNDALTRLNRNLGARIRNYDEEAQVKSSNNIKRVEEILSSQSHLDEMTSTIQRSMALIDAMQNTLDASHFNDDPAITTHRERLVQLSNAIYEMESKVFESKQTQEVLQNTVRDVFKEIEKAPEAIKSLFGRHYRDSRKVANSIAPAVSVIGQPTFTRYDTVDELFSSLGMSEQRRELITRRYNQWKAHLGSSDYFDIAERDGQTYLRVYADKNKKRFIGLGYLDLGRNAAAAYDAPLYIRNNESLTTTYMADRYITDVESAKALLAHGRTNITEDLIRQHSKPWEDVLNNIAFAHLKSGGGRIMGSRKQLGARIRGLMSVAARPAVEHMGGSEVVDRFRNHLRLSGRTEQNFLLVTGLDRLPERERWRMVQELSATSVTDPTARDERAMGRVWTPNGYAYHAEIGLYNNSPLAQYDVPERKLVGEKSLLRRRYVPKTSRLEQSAGREEMFLSTGPNRFRNDIFQSGAERAPIGYSSDATGGTNKLFVYYTGDSSEGLGLALDGQGVGYHIGSERAIRSISKPILNPLDNLKSGTKLTRYLMTHDSNQLVEFDIINGILFRHETTVGADGKEITKRIRFSPYLGHGTESRQFLRFNGQQKKVWLGWQNASVSDKSLINIIGAGIEEIDSPKLFSPGFKGTAQRVHPRTFNRLLGDGRQIVQRVMKGGTRKDVILTIPDQLFKAPGSVTQSVINNLAYFLNNKDFGDAVIGHARHGFNSNTDDASIQLFRSAIAVAGARIGLDPVNAGLALNIGHAGFVRGGTKRKYGYTDAMFEADVRAAFGTNADVVLEHARGKYGMAFGTAFKGSGVGDWGAAMGSTEPRVVFNMYHQLKLMGFSQDKATDFIANMYKHKKGNAQGLKTANAFINMYGSITNNHTLVKELAEGSLDTVSVHDLISDGKPFLEQLKKRTNGFMLDFGIHDNTPQARALLDHVHMRFNGSSQIYIPGADILKNSDSTMINTAHGKMPVGQELEGTINEFLHGLQRIGGSPLTINEHVDQVLGEFKDSIINLGSEAIHNSLSGKVATSHFAYSNLYDFTSQATSNLSPSSFKLGQRIMEHTGGNAIFMNSQGFVSDMIAAKDAGLSKKQVIRNLERFFTAYSPDSEASMQGIVTFWTRHPSLSLGNVSPTQVFRALGEGSDTFLPEFLSTKRGRNWKARLGETPTWNDVAKLNRDERTRLFSDFLSNMRRFVGEGGGVVSIPRNIATATMNGKSLIVDIGLAAGGLGDHDGDQEQIMYFDDQYAKEMIGGMKSKEYQRSIMEYRIRSQIYGQETKKALRVLEARRLGIAPTDLEESVLDEMYQDILKEGRGKQTIGPLDNQINRLRRAVGANLDAGASLDALADISAFLKMSEEHISIKTKKLPSYEDLSTQLKNHIDEALSPSGSTQNLEDFFRNVVFADSDLFNGVTVTHDLGEFTMNLNDTLKGLANYINSARTTGVSDYASASSIAGTMRSGTHAEMEQLINILRAGDSPTGAAVRGFNGKDSGVRLAEVSRVANQVVNHMNTFNAKHASGVALAGLGLSMAASMLIGNDFDSLPRGGPTGIVSQVRGLTQPRDPNVSSDNLISRPGSDMVGATGMRTTYMSQPNPYQVRGNIKSLNVLSSWQHYIARTNGNMSVMINDTRRPITQNYMDRVTGEY